MSANGSVYRCRLQRLTRKVVLQIQVPDGWVDAHGINENAISGDPMLSTGFVSITPEHFAETNTELLNLRARVEKYERRAKGQRDANEKRKAKPPGFQIAGGNESF